MPCKYYDCGWCYAPEDLITTSNNGACNNMAGCPQSFDDKGREAVSHILSNRDTDMWPEPNLPPINLDNSLSADDFYPDYEAPPNGGLEEDDAM